MGWRTIIDIGRLPADSVPPRTLGAFVWHFVRQIWPLIVLIMFLEAASASLQAVSPLLLGWLVNDISKASRAQDVIDQPWLLHVGVPILAGFGLCQVALWYVYDHHYMSRFNNLIRHQLNCYTLGQSMSYFQNDFAGRIASKVIEGGPALRDPIRSLVGAVWYAVFFTATSISLLLLTDFRLGLPAMVWLVAYIGSLVYFVPKIKDKGLQDSRYHTRIVGHINDIYANILSVKLFGRERFEAAKCHGLLEQHCAAKLETDHLIWLMGTIQTCMNVALMIATPWTALLLWRDGAIMPGAIVMALPMVQQMVNMSGWIRLQVTVIFYDMSRVEDCIETISKPYTVVDAAGAGVLEIAPEGGSVSFDRVSFNYGKAPADDMTIDGLTLDIPAGQKIGLVGRSGAGKSTLVGLLLRFHDVAGGVISIGGQDISKVTQESLRQHVAMVSQDSSLLHRSVADNIRYGKALATDAEVVEAARRAHAHDFILGLEDAHGNTGYEAQVGERGVKLSGGQRQRIAIARVILESAPILVLDEATSALDSEVEAAIQQEMTALMVGKTTIAIAHRLSTIAQMDRLLILDGGRIVEDGAHADLLAANGLYADLWRRQSGGFLAED